MDFRRLLLEERRRARESAAGQKPQELTQVACAIAHATVPPTPKVETIEVEEIMHNEAMSCWLERHPLNLELFRVPGIQSVFYIPEWLSQDEEAAVLDRVYSAPATEWVQLKLRRLQMYGGIVQPPFRPEPLPHWLQQMADALVANKIFSPDTRPNHALINEYGVGEGILPHEDGPAYFPLVAIASTGADAFVQFTPHRAHAHSSSLGSTVDSPGEIRLPVRRRSLLLFTEDAYTKYLHSIDSVESGKRVSLTIRHVHVTP